MPVALNDIILTYIDEALDVDDLENIGDAVRSSIIVENIEEWQMKDVLKQLYADLTECFRIEPDPVRRLRLKAAITHFEADFWDYLVCVETSVHRPQ
jgi:hypothetical protein